MAGQDAAKRAGDWAKGRWADFRQESPYFQAKVGLAAAYAVVVVLTIFLAPPRGEKWQCTQERIPFGLSFKTAVILDNLRNGDLDNVVIDVRGTGIEFDGKKTPGTWHTKPMSLPEALPTRIFAEQLFDAQGGNPPYALDVDDLTVKDKKGRVIVELHPQKRSAP